MSSPAPHRAPMSDRRFVARVAIVFGTAAALLLLWHLADAVLLGFAGVLLAMLLQFLARPLDRYTPLPYGLCLALSGILLLALIAWALFLFGSQVWSEFDTLLSRIQQGSAAIREHLGSTGIGRAVLAQLHRAASMMAGIVRQALTDGISALEAILVIGFSAVYLAAQPALYRDGALLLIPRRHRGRAAEAFDRVGHAVRLWLMGQLIEMAVIGALTAGATWLIGLPTPLALGLIAGITEFVPYLGPIVAAVPALLVAVTQGPEVVLWTFGAYLTIHLFEGNVLMPLLQRWLVSVPPALMLLGIAAFGLLFGLLGVILAAPMVVALFTAVRKLYVEDALGEPPQGGEPRRTADAAQLDRPAPEMPPPWQGDSQVVPHVRALTLVHVVIVLLALAIVGGEVADRVGGTVPWPRRYEGPVSLSALALVYLSALHHRASSGRGQMRGGLLLPMRVGLRLPATLHARQKPMSLQPVSKLPWLRRVEAAIRRLRAFSWKGGLS